MSASREKKQRQNEGLTEKQRKEQKEAQKNKVRNIIYIVMGAIVLVLIAALLIWHSGIIQRSTTAATVDDEKFNAGEVSYYYYSVKNQTVNMAKQYAQYGMSYGYDTTLEPSEQIYNQDTGETYEEYFKQTALDNLRWVVLMDGEAKKAGYTLSDDGKAQIQSAKDSIAKYSTQSGYTKAAYLKLLYGTYMTETIFNQQIEMNVLAQEYSTYYKAQFTYTDAELEDYYKENSATLDTYDFRYCFIPSNVETTKDASGNEQAATDEQKAAAQKVAVADAEKMIARVKAGEAFNTVAADYVSSDTAASFADAEYNHVTDKLGSDISSTAYGSWVTDASRVKGDCGYVESGTSGCYVILFNSRVRSEDIYQTVDVRHILIKAETTAAASDASASPSPSDSTDTTTALPTAEQLAAAKAKAEELLAQWKAGDATSESFATLANENSDDTGSNTNGGLYEGVTRGQMITSFNDWCFAAGRKVGDTGIVENTDSSGNVLGYHVMYMEKLGEIRWKYQANSDLASADYNTWYNGLEFSYVVKAVDKGMALVG
ncbi:hypothetical protein SDC9_81876 [bioreactor metagenome]|uniref:PpiC domain-containing protein n=1 Tax=bioreactor metagenome TaxID=1076179 RepID=A0A644Z352_9ZZZZ